MADSDAVTVLFANNYDMPRARGGWVAGTYPAHHLYGTARLGEGFEVVDLPFSERDLAARLTRLTRRKLGDVGQQLAALRARRPARGGAVVYGAAANELRGLVSLRAAGLLRTPIVGVFHSAPLAGGGARARMLGGFDRVIALSERTRAGLIASGVEPQRVSVLPWGADLDFPGFAPRLPAAADAPVVSTGKTGRDMATLLRALAASGLPARVYGDRAELAAAGPIAAGVSVRPVASNDARRGPMVYDEAVMADLRAAAVVAIPLLDPNRLTGLTEVVDALACGRALILTRSPYFDFDIEEIGCGWWVQPGDVRGWRERLEHAMSDRARLEEMGRAGRVWAEQHLNERLFTQGLRGVLGGLSSASAAPRG